MKKLYSYFGNRFPVWMLLLLLVSGEYACTKDDAPPVINKVALVDAALRDSSITAVLPGTLVHITGSGFANLQQVFFNDVPAAINTALNTPNSIIVTVPDNAPTGADGTQVPNTVKVVTANGVAIYTFALLPPPPSITAVSNENATAGTQIIIRGTNFYSLTSVKFGTVAATGYTYNDTAVTVTVPTLTAAAPVIVAGKYGADTTVFFFNLAAYPATGVLADFENGSSYMGWQYWGGINTNGAAAYKTTFPGYTGDFIVVNPTAAIPAGNGGWYSDNRAVMVAAGAWMSTSELVNAVGNYALKFEIAVNPNKPWTNGAIMIVPNGNFNYMARYAPYESTSGKSFSTSGWQTVTIPLTSFLKGTGSYNATGSPAAYITDLTGGGNSASLQLMLYNDGEADVTAFSAGFDNVRIVKVK